MAVVNTITIAKSGGSFTSVDEIKGAFLTALDALIGEHELRKVAVHRISINFVSDDNIFFLIKFIN